MAITLGVRANTVSVEGYAGDGTCWLLHFQSSDQEEVGPGLRTRNWGWAYRLSGWLNRGLGHVSARI